jgi:hypothetical protein
MVLYEILINGKSEWVTLKAAAILNETFLATVEFGEKVLDKGIIRNLSDEDKHHIIEVADDLIENRYQ